MHTITISWTQFSPEPEKIKVTVLHLGAPYITIPVEDGTQTQTQLSVQYPTQEYAATAEPIYQPVPCTLS